MKLDGLLQGMASFAVFSPTHFPLHFAQVFLVVAKHGQCTYETVTAELGLSNAAVSRTVNALGQRNRKGKPGLTCFTWCVIQPRAAVFWFG